MRQRILSEVYREQEARPDGDGLFVGDLEKRLGCSLSFDIGYLRSKGWLLWDGGYLQLSADGMDAVEGGN